MGVFFFSTRAPNALEIFIHRAAVGWSCECRNPRLASRPQADLSSQRKSEQGKSIPVCGAMSHLGLAPFCPEVRLPLRAAQSNASKLQGPPPKSFWKEPTKGWPALPGSSVNLLFALATILEQAFVASSPRGLTNISTRLQPCSFETHLLTSYTLSGLVCHVSSSFLYLSHRLIPR